MASCSCCTGNNKSMQHLVLSQITQNMWTSSLQPRMCTYILPSKEMASGSFFTHGRTTTHIWLCPKFLRICGHILFQRKEMVSSGECHSLHDKDMYICSSKQKMASCGFCTWKNNNSTQHLVVSQMWTFIIQRKAMGSSRFGAGIPLPPYQVSKQRVVLHSEEQQLNATFHWVPNPLSCSMIGNAQEA